MGARNRSLARAYRHVVHPMITTLAHPKMMSPSVGVFAGCAFIVLAVLSLNEFAVLVGHARTLRPLAPSPIKPAQPVLWNYTGIRPAGVALNLELDTFTFTACHQPGHRTRAACDAADDAYEAERYIGGSAANSPACESISPSASLVACVTHARGCAWCRRTHQCVDLRHADGACGGTAADAWCAMPFVQSPVAVQQGANNQLMAMLSEIDDARRHGTVYVLKKFTSIAQNADGEGWLHGKRAFPFGYLYDTREFLGALEPHACVISDADLPVAIQSLCIPTLRYDDNAYAYCRSDSHERHGATPERIYVHAAESGAPPVAWSVAQLNVTYDSPGPGWTTVQARVAPSLSHSYYVVQTVSRHAILMDTSVSREMFDATRRVWPWVDTLSHWGSPPLGGPARTARRSWAAFALDGIRPNATIVRAADAVFAAMRRFPEHERGGFEFGPPNGTTLPGPNFFGLHLRLEDDIFLIGHSCDVYDLMVNRTDAFLERFKGGPYQARVRSLLYIATGVPRDVVMGVKSVPPVHNANLRPNALRTPAGPWWASGAMVRLCNMFACVFKEDFPEAAAIMDQAGYTPWRDAMAILDMWILTRARLFWGFDTSTFSVTTFAMRTRVNLPNAIWDCDGKGRGAGEGRGHNQRITEWLGWPVDYVHPYRE